MRGPGSTVARSKHLRRYSWALAGLWTLVAGASWMWNLRVERQEILDVARANARGSYNKDLVYRRWAAAHGGVYVPITEDTPPNPYLSHVEERDITTPSGKRLTLVNPAYMTRQVHELGKEQYGARGHITSLNPLRPENAPDAWETEALRAFERGESEVDAVELVDGEPYVRLMRPVRTEQRCLKCHAKQGYQVGDIRGGISVSVALKPYQVAAVPHMALIALGHGVLWILGLGGLCWGTLRLQAREREREAAETALRESEERFREFVEGTTDLVTQVDGEGRFTYVNHAAGTIYGATHDACIGQSAFGFVHPDDQALTKKWFDECVRNRTSGATIENRQVSRTGDVRDTIWTCNFHYDAEGNVQYINGIARDITERKRNEEVLSARVRLSELSATHSSKDLLQAFLDEAERLSGSAIGFFHFLEEDEKKIVLQSWSTNTLDNMCSAEGEGMPYALDKAGVWVDCVRQRRPVIHNDYASLPHRKGLPQGHAPVIRELVVPVFREGKIVAILGVGNKKGDYDQDDLQVVTHLADLGWDIVERKRAEEEARRLRLLLKNMIDSMPSSLVAIDAEGRVTHWNHRAEETTGVSLEEAEGQPLEKAFPAMEAQLAQVSEAIRRREAMKTEKVESFTDGERHISDVMVYPLVANGVDGAVIRVDDVTARVNLEEMVIQSEKMLTVGGLAAGMAHEINNPLAAIIQNIQVVLECIASDQAANHEAARACGTSLEAIRAYMDRQEITGLLDAVRTSGGQAAQIVENMLSFSRKSDAYFSTHSLSGLIDQTVELAASDYNLKKKFDFKQIEIIREFDPDLPEVTCEGSKIQQVILNLLKNGAQAMAEQKDRTDTPRFILRTLRDGNMARIEVEDNGPGMSQEVRKRVFEPFFTTKDVGVGTGLGLSVSYFIVTENHGGTMVVESTPGHGARFIIGLPMER